MLVKVILFPTTIRSIKSQKAMSALQPKIEEIKKKYKNDKEKQSRELFELYQREKINPFSGCLPLIIQFPILLTLYQVFINGFSANILIENAYHFLGNIEPIKLTLFGLLDLSKQSIYLAVLAGILQFFQSKISLVPALKNSGGKTNILQNQMVYFFPILTVFIVWKFGSLIGLYWVTNTAFSIVENLLIIKNKKKSKIN